MARVQFNLLPDIKLAYDKTHKTQQRVVSAVILASAVSLGLFLIMFVLAGPLQKKLITNADKDITNYNNQIQAIPNLSKIVTIQNQLASLPALHQKKHITSRLFDDLPQLLPPNASISNLTLDSTANTITITGTADTVAVVNTFVDTLKFTKYTTSANSKDSQNAFSSVILTSVGRDSKNAPFTVTASFASILFDGTSSVTLQVPTQLTTRSITNTPPLFNTPPPSDSGSSTSGGSQ